MGYICSSMGYFGSSMGYLGSSMGYFGSIMGYFGSIMGVRIRDFYFLSWGIAGQEIKMVIMVPFAA